MICTANQLTGFYIRAILTFIGLNQNASLLILRKQFHFKFLSVILHENTVFKICGKLKKKTSTKKPYLSNESFHTYHKVNLYLSETSKLPELVVLFFWFHQHLVAHVAWSYCISSSEDEMAWPSGKEKKNIDRLLQFSISVETIKVST